MRILTVSSGLLLIQVLAAGVCPAGEGPVKFTMHRVGTFRSEACGTGDFNNDGQVDIVAGEFVYLAPDYKPWKIRTLKGKVDDQGKGYNWDFMNVPMDVDGDGLLDVVSCSWHGKQIDWYRNTGPPGGPWPQTLIELNGNFEHGDLWDIDGDGKANEILPGVTGTVWYELGKGPHGKRGLIKRVISQKTHDWGVGAGDVNGDGRPDVLRPGAWFEAPADPRHGKWKEHPLAVGAKHGKPGHTPHICVYDVNADGLNDIITSSAHQYGIFWYEQTRAEHLGHIFRVLAVRRDLCEISGGSDDGLLVGHELHVYRTTSAGQAYAARIQVVDIYDDKSICRIQPGSPKLPVLRMDLVNSRRPDFSHPVQLPPWKQHTIDDTWSQAHAITLADLDDDGDLDFVTGKRFMAHDGNDPGGYEPLGVYWYELDRGPNPRWTKHVLSYDQGIGAGMNVPVVDLDGDGDLDVVVTGKWGGPVWFENRRK